MCTTPEGSEVAAVLSPAEELLERYRRYLLVERVLTVGSVRVYVRSVRPFVMGLEGPGGLELERSRQLR